MLTIILVFLKEMAKALFFKLAWRTIAERFFTRLVVYGLEKLRAMSSNKVLTSTVDDILKSLEGKQLHVVDQKLKADRARRSMR